MEKIIEIPLEYKRLFDNDWREAAVYGGRFSLKSHTVARYLLIRARQEKVRVACFREFQNSIAESSHQLLSDLIKLYELNDFLVTDNSIVNKVTGSDFLFKGLWQNEQSIKSIEGIDIAWVEEAQTVSQESLDVLTPTIRKPNSKIIYTYNRLLENDPVHNRLVIEGRPNTLIININYHVALKYGLMPEVSRLEMEDDKMKRPMLYQHKWLGEPLKGDGKVFRRIRENACTLPEEPQSGVDYFVGVDLARHVDWTVIKVFRTDTWKEVYHDRFNQIDYNLQKAKIEAVIRRYNNAMARIDATGVGDPIVEDLKMQGLGIEGFVFTANSKAQIIQNLVMMLESDQIKILPEETTVKELEAFAYEVGHTGRVRYSAPEGQHDDCVMALALAVYKLPPKSVATLTGVEFLNREIETKYNQYGEPI